jgi:integrase
VSIDAALTDLNTRLKQGHHRCAVERRKASLVLRATLVDREGTGPARRQRIPLGLPADYTALPEAERQAIELSHQLRTGTFTWAAWDTPTTSTPEGVLTMADFRAAAERLHATKYARDPERGTVAWSKKWRPALNKLPVAGPVTETVLLRIIRSMPAGSAGRRDQGNLIAQVAKSLAFDPEPLLAACRGYGVESLTERDIPNDRAIESAWSRIRLPHWRWTWGMCAAYGLRPHECAALEWLPDDWIQVGDATKTGARRVTPCPSRWVNSFRLHDLERPTQKARTITKAFLDALDRDGVAIRPYNLRHAYALRLMDRGVAPELGARLMGHSLSTHQAVYKRWIEADRIQKALAGVQL